MRKYPSVSQVKAQSKYISKTLNLKISHAREAVAYMYGCFDFKELIGKSGFDADSLPSYRLPFPTPERLKELDNHLEPHLDSIKHHLDPSIHLESSFLARTSMGIPSTYLVTL